MSKVFLFGIDSFDRLLLDKFKSDLPNFSKLLINTPDIRMSSVLPPDSASAWSSIYTGSNPAEHGVVYFVDPLDKVNSTVNEIVDSTSIKGNTFWDIASEKNKRVCILFPHVCYPGWEVNGIMVVRNEVNYEIKCYPKNVIGPFSESDLMVLQGLPTNNEKRLGYIEMGKRLMDNELKLSEELYKKESWDIFFTYSSVMDYISHNFWNYFDENDPSYPGDTNPFKNTIKDFYIYYDNILGKYLQIIDSKTCLFVFSDHGHGLRPPKIFDLNKYLESMGLYYPKSTRPDGPLNSLSIKRFLNYSKNYVNTNPWTWNLAMKGLNLFPKLRKAFTSPPSVDWSKTIAYSSDQSGIKAYTYGGIIINKNNLGDMNYEQLRTDIIQRLQDVEVNSQKLFKYVCKREIVYTGRFIEKYPDIVFELIDGYGIGQTNEPSLFGSCSTHNIQPGSHRRDSPVFLTLNCDLNYIDNCLSLMDISELILETILSPNGTRNEV